MGCVKPSAPRYGGVDASIVGSTPSSDGSVSALRLARRTIRHGFLYGLIDFLRC